MACCWSSSLILFSLKQTYPAHCQILTCHLFYINIFSQLCRLQNLVGLGNNRVTKPLNSVMSILKLKLLTRGSEVLFFILGLTSYLSHINNLISDAVELILEIHQKPWICPLVECFNNVLSLVYFRDRRHTFIISILNFNLLNPMNSQDNFSLQYQYNIKQTKQE